MNKDNYRVYKKIRRSWGVVKPATKIIDSKKKYDRNKEKDIINKILKSGDY